MGEVRSFVLEHRHVIVRGAGTKPAMVRPLSGAGILRTDRLSGMIEYEPAEFVFSAFAGTPVAEVRRRLEHEGQFLPFDPLLIERGSTLGGAVASGLAGPGRLRYGGPRDFIIGVKFVTGLGEVACGGGKVVKNAAGFDLPKLMVGSRGSLGVLVELTLKVFPRPPEYRTLVVDYPSLPRALNELDTGNASPVTFEALDLMSPARLALRVGGRPDAVALRTEAARKLLGRGEILTGTEEAEFWREATELSWVPDGWSLWKIPLTPSRIAELEASLQGIECRCRYSVGGNLCWLAAGGDQVDGSVLPDDLARVAVPVFGEPGLGPPSSRLDCAFSCRIRQALDPHGRFPEI
ncbi:MAG: FAD-binding protein [Acidobacteriota bacterium]